MAIDPYAISMIASTAAPMLSSFFGGKNKNPATGAIDRLGQIPGAVGGQMQPWVDQSNAISPQVMELFQQLMGNPSGALGKMGEGYQSSPGYNFARDEAMRAIGNTSASGGMTGTPQHQQWAADTASGLASRDYNQYMQNAMSMLGMGIKGGEGVMGRGFNASTNIADILAQVLGSQAGYDYAGTAGANQKTSQDWSNMFSGAGQLMPWMFGRNHDNWQQFIQNRPNTGGVM